MKIINSNLTSDISLADKVWNDAMETVAARCEDEAQALCSVDGDSESWVWPIASRFQAMAGEFRKQKRGLK